MLTLLTNIKSTRGRMVTIPRMVTLQLQTFLPYASLALKNSYRTGLWLPNFIRGREFGIETYFDGRRLLMEDDL